MSKENKPFHMSYGTELLKLYNNILIQFTDWPMQFPPPLKIDRKSFKKGKSTVGDREVTAVRLAEMNIIHANLEKPVLMTAPVEYDLTVFHNGFLYFVENAFGNDISVIGVSTAIWRMLLHEIMHFMTNWVYYFRCYRGFDEESRSASYDVSAEEYLHYVVSHAEDKMTEYNNEKMTLQLYMAMIFDRRGPIFDDLFHDQVFVPNLGGPFIKNIIKTQPDSGLTEMLLVLRHCYFNNETLKPGVSSDVENHAYDEMEWCIDKMNKLAKRKDQHLDQIEFLD